jgi:hypothetical protein
MHSVLCNFSKLKKRKFPSQFSLHARSSFFFVVSNPCIFHRILFLCGFNNAKYIFPKAHSVMYTSTRSHACVFTFLPSMKVHSPPLSLYSCSFCLHVHLHIPLSLRNAFYRFFQSTSFLSPTDLSIPFISPTNSDTQKSVSIMRRNAVTWYITEISVEISNWQDVSRKLRLGTNSIIHLPK